MRVRAARSSAAVTVVVSRRVRPGHMIPFSTAMRNMLESAEAFPGFLGGELVLPQDATAESFAHAVVAFEGAAELARWHNSIERARVLEQLRPHVTGYSQISHVPGLERWFTSPVTLQPQRWKVALLTWLGIFPLVFLQSVALSGLLEEWPQFARLMLITATSVVMMAWVIAPALNRSFARWLRVGARRRTP